MLETIRINNWLVEIDVAKTRAFYERGIDVCTCLDCQNFVAACQRLEQPVAHFFQQLGIQVTMPAHLSQFSTAHPMKKLYIGHYHLVGNLLEGERSNTSNWNPTNTMAIQNFIVGFSDEVTFVSENVPEPVLQLDFEADICWVLDEQPEDM